MPTLNIFVSFEFDKDEDLKNNFYEQAKRVTPHRVRDCSLDEAHPDQGWRDKAQAAIRECGVVVVLVGRDTHNAQGVIVETDMARSLGKPVIQIRPKGRPHGGLTRLGDPIPWKWRTINARLDAVRSRRR